MCEYYVVACGITPTVRTSNRANRTRSRPILRCFAGTFAGGLNNNPPGGILKAGPIAISARANVIKVVAIRVWQTRQPPDSPESSRARQCVACVAKSIINCSRPKKWVKRRPPARPTDRRLCVALLIIELIQLFGHDGKIELKCKLCRPLSEESSSFECNCILFWVCAGVCLCASSRGQQ